MGVTDRPGHDLTVSRPAAAPGSGVLARARTSFLVNDPVQAGLVREPILASWTRSRLWAVPTDALDVPFDADFDADSVLARAADPVLRDVADSMATEAVSVILCDARGTVLRRCTGDSALQRHLDRVRLAPGFNYAEQHVGTNGIGTALEILAPAQVFGHEHYAEHLEDLACAGVPIRHPMSGKVLGVVDLTCWRRDAGMMMVPAAAIARRVEELLLEQSGRRELALLQEYLMTCRRNRGAVVAIGDDMLVLNDRARALIGSEDQGALLAEASDALAGGGGQLVVDLPSGLTVRVQCKAVVGDRGLAGGVLQVQPVAALRVTQARALPPPPAPALTAAVGSGALWMKCHQAVDRHFRAREWLVLEGEAGTGKTTLARATPRSRTPAAHLRVLDAEDYGREWIGEVTEELEVSGGALVLTHVDRLPPEGVQALVDLLEPHRESTDLDRPWIVATVSGPSSESGSTRSDPGFDDLLACFPRTVEVPPLRYHVEDIAELVPHLLARLNRGATLSCSPEAMRVLMRNRWPGNVEQLHQVLRKVMARRRSGVIEVRDLPPECRAMTRRVLTPLEGIECDAIVDALAETEGNKAEAARLLGMSRATIYRKILRLRHLHCGGERPG